MGRCWSVIIAAVTLPAGLAFMQGPAHLNPVVELLTQRRPVFGLYAPRNPRAGGRGGRNAAPPATATTGAGARGSATPDAAPPKTPAQLAREALSHDPSDYIFDGSMEGDFDRAFPTFTEFVRGAIDSGTVEQRRRHPLIVKTHLIAPDPALAAQRIGRQLNLGVSGIVFVGVESADEVRTGLAAMRFRSKGGTRPDDVGDAPAYWGVSEAEYRRRADVWPLDPNGELVNWTIVESREGLAHVREIAAVPGIGVLLPGAGTLRGVFTTTDSTGQRVFDQQGWEGAIQQVLAACKELQVPCGYPATERDIQERMRQGFSVFVINWGEPGFRAVDIGRRAADRSGGARE